VTEFLIGLFAVVVVSFMAFTTGVDTGKAAQCKKMKAEYYEGECVIVQRKKVEL
jgi:hypothetical protein